MSHPTSETIDAPGSSPFPEYMDAQRGHRKRSHRAGKGRGKHKAAAVGAKPDHMAEANAHIKKAHDHPTPQGTTAHLFRALSSLKKC